MDRLAARPGSSGTMLKPGQIAPEFSLSDAQGVSRSLTVLLRDGPMLLYFYPADFTPMCTKQACAFRDRAQELREAGVQLVGISSASARRHEQFAGRFHLSFMLLADPHRRVARQYEATALAGLMPRRISYFIGSDQRIIDAHEANLSVASHGRFIDRIISHQQAQASGRQGVGV